MIDTQMWNAFSQAYAFFGNSLLSPMSKTSDAGLDPDFWRAFPDFSDEGVVAAVDGALSFAEEAQRKSAQGGNAVQDVSVEYTHLFVGPSPAAAPWETMYRGVSGSETSAGFGQATYEMRALLRAAGLELRNENNQYEDHIGIELLYLSELCRRRSCDDSDATASDAAVFSFIETHPLAWIGALRDAVELECFDGYLRHILGVAEALLRRHAKLLV
ncbi:MAG: molecular chaperone TorD family protein [Slackia sp.]|nr:molecular chaperone TorD family protein [Slackia sp.]